MPHDSETRIETTLIVFTISSPLADVQKWIAESDNNSFGSVVCLTTHELFDFEMSVITGSTSKKVHFYCFAELLSDSEMEAIDVTAYHETSSLPHTTREDYYARIKVLKNQKVLQNLQAKYDVKAGALLNDNLGIHTDTWLGLGLNSVFQPKASHSFQSFNILKTLESFRESIEQLGACLYILNKDNDTFLFFGSPKRVSKHLDQVHATRFRLHPVRTIEILVSIILGKLSGKKLETIRKSLLTRCIVQSNDYCDVCSSLSSVHEYRPLYAKIAKSLQLPFDIMQDSFLPENYTSKYLFFYDHIRAFLVWDKLSRGIFEKDNLPVEESSLFKRQTLPSVEVSEKAMRSILVLTSGSGDWTALKNRSDEDRLAKVFVELARKCPELDIVFRCHPLWVHPEHQGQGSIERIQEYFTKSQLSNIRVSSESSERASDKSTLQNFSVPISSLRQDLEQADIVFGSHSFSMVSAALDGKPFCSVNVTGVRNLFQNYTRLGFNHCENLVELMELLNDPVAVRQRHNTAVLEYNTNWL